MGSLNLHNSIRNIFPDCNYSPLCQFWEQNQSGFEAYFFHIMENSRSRMSGVGCWWIYKFIHHVPPENLQNAKHMSFRFIRVNYCRTIFDTTVFMTVPLQGRCRGMLSLSWPNGWLFKVGYEIVALPLSVPIAKWVKRKEGVNISTNRKSHWYNFLNIVKKSPRTSRGLSNTIGIQISIKTLF